MTEASIESKTAVAHVLNGLINAGRAYRCPYCKKVLMGGKDRFGFYNCDKCGICGTKDEEWRREVNVDEL